METWLPAIILAALLIGWLLGRVSKKTSNTSSDDPVNCSEHYIQGLNYLLANKSDKAIELFVDLIKVDKETMETHLALGNLFRSKGEVDRAIKIHQNLIARPSLDQSQRTMALTELAEDYLKAGLLDRAENLYKELIQLNPQNSAALHKLLEIFSLEKSWPQAREVAQSLYEIGEPGSRLVLTHCYCEMAEQAMREGNLREMREYLDQAIRIDKQCVRALLLLIDLHLRGNDDSRARQLFTQLVNSNPQFIELYLKPAREILLQRGSADRYQEFLLQQYEKKPNGAVALELLLSYQVADRNREIIEFLPRALQLSGSIDLIDFAFRYLRKRPDQLDDLWTEIPEVLQLLSQKRVSYVCTACGFAGQAMLWHCPSCRAWSTIKPVG